MVIKHKDLESFPKWTTKEIVIFARQFGYTPPIKMQSPFSIAIQSTLEMELENPAQLSNIIKKEIKRERMMYHRSISYNSRISNWINQWFDCRKNQKHVSGSYRLNENDIINVDDIDDFIKQPKIKLEPNVNHNINEKTQETILLSSDTDGAWISKICQDVQVKLKPEEIIEGKYNLKNKLKYC